MPVVPVWYWRHPNLGFVTESQGIWPTLIFHFLEQIECDENEVLKIPRCCSAFELSRQHRTVSRVGPRIHIDVLTIIDPADGRSHLARGPGSSSLSIGSLESLNLLWLSIIWCDILNQLESSQSCTVRCFQMSWSPGLLYSSRQNQTLGDRIKTRSEKKSFFSKT